jgi:CubicO group peptidase (beta-lactamase class C family)
MTEDTIFDLASLTKPIVVGTLVHWLADHGKLDLDDRVASHLPRFGVKGKSQLTVRQLLLHTSGMPASNPLRNYKSGKAKALSRLYATYPEALPERRFIYSDLGYIVLGEMIEEIVGEPLDEVARKVLWQPLGMSDTDFRRTDRAPGPDLDRVAPTEFAGGRRRSPILGEVHDPRAYGLGGVAGNAGLFSTAGDLARFARMLLGGGTLDGFRILSESALTQFTEPVAVPGGARRTLGWDVSSTYSRARGRELSEGAFGHGGYTGTSLWVDPELDVFVLFLSNRNHPYGTGKVLPLQGAIADAALTAMRKSAGDCDPQWVSTSSGVSTPGGGKFCSGRLLPRSDAPGLL